MIDITPAELAFLREAVDEKHASLMAILQFKEPEPVWEPVKASDIPSDAIDFLQKAAKRKVTKKKVAKKVEAPWGYKKDGTPKKKPGIQAGF